jgi:crotonobetainyl-CoA:carnitine CoA-transferase CaiB-like acyl-CoA transferase
MNTLPLSNITILELGSSLSGSYASQLMAKFGAKIFINEPTPTGSPLRYLVPEDYQIKWWNTISKNKLSITIDISSLPNNISVSDILSHVDVVITDIGPARWEMDPWLKHYTSCLKKPLVIDIYSSGTDMPHLWQGSSLAEFTAATSGMMHLTGWEDGPPVAVEAPIAEYLAGMMAASGALAELGFSRKSRASPRPISMAMHEAVLRMIEWQLPIAALEGKPVLRNGNNFPMNAGISNMPLTKDGKYIAISAASQEVAMRLLHLIGGPELANHPDYSTPKARADHMKNLYLKLNAWVSTKTQEEILRIAQEADIVVGPIYNALDILHEPMVIERNNLTPMQLSSHEDTLQTVHMPKVSGIRQVDLSNAPDLGAHTLEFLKLISQKKLNQPA